MNVQNTSDSKSRIGDRRTPADRRTSETRRLKWQPPANPDAPTTTIFITVGYAPDGLTPIEIFYNSGYRSGSDLEALVSDICIILSVFIQHDGVDIAAFASAISRAMDARSGREIPSSLVGLLLDELQRPPNWAADLNTRAELRMGKTDD